MNDGVWESLLREPAFEKQLRQWIDRIALERVQATIGKLESDTREKAQREGYEAGLAEARKSTEGALQTLHQISTQVLSEKTALLASHERIFCEALLSLMEKLAVPDVQSWMAQVEGILQKYKAEFSEKARVEVSVSHEFLKTLEASGVKSVDGLRWSIKGSDTLSTGDIQIDFGGVGLQLLPASLLQQWKSALSEDVRKTG